MRIDAVLSCARHAGHRLNDKTYSLFYGRRPEPAWVILRRWRYRPQAFGGRHAFAALAVSQSRNTRILGCWARSGGYTK